MKSEPVIVINLNRIYSDSIIRIPTKARTIMMCKRNFFSRVSAIKCFLVSHIFVSEVMKFIECSCCVRSFLLIVILKTWLNLTFLDLNSRTAFSLILCQWWICFDILNIYLFLSGILFMLIYFVNSILSNLMELVIYWRIVIVWIWQWLFVLRMNKSTEFLFDVKILYLLW